MFTSAPARRAVIYTRISVSQDESVSIARQVESAQQYAAARGWQVVGQYVDDGVSATANQPEDRTGWRALLNTKERYDTVIIWKVDRLARRVLDFLLADRALQQRGAGIVAVEDPIDMTTDQGRAFATMLAVFGEMEAAAIRARVKAARAHLLRNGRVPGGTVPYGWRSVRNPDGAGYVLAQDPDRIEYVRGAAERAERGDTLYSVKQWLDEVGAPLPGVSQKHRKRPGWHYGTVERLLRNPVLAGMTAFNPGNESKVRGDQLLRDEDGLPVVDPSVAIMSVGRWRAMVKRLDTRDSAQARPRAMKTETSGLLSGLVQCGHCDRRMWRSTHQKRQGYSCPGCHQTITNFEDYVVEQFLWAKGDRVRWSLVEDVVEGGAVVLPEIEHRLDELDTAIRDASSREERRGLQDQQAALLDLRDEKRTEESAVVQREVRGTQHYAQDWADAATVEDQRAVLEDALAAVVVRRGRVGRGLDKGRLTFEWKHPDEVGPVEPPSDATLAEWSGQ